MVEKQIGIDPLSLISLSLETYFGSTSIASATGFVVQNEGIGYLVTNWHVVSGRDPATNKPLSANGLTPDRLAIWHHIRGRLGTWGRRIVHLRTANGEPHWLEHPKGREVDVVVLRLTTDEEVQVYPVDLNLAKTGLLVSPSEPVSIIGFPFGLSAGGKFPIWKTGHVASDIDLDYERNPAFLIDATTKPGMSGSPVVAYRIGGYRTMNGWKFGGSATRFLGIYSAQLQQPELGMVWKPTVVTEIIR